MSNKEFVVLTNALAMYTSLMRKIALDAEGEELADTLDFIETAEQMQKKVVAEYVAANVAEVVA